MAAALSVLCAAYVLSQFFRTFLAVLAPELQRDLGLDPARLGVLSSAWFWAFAAAQLPIGMALDRFGPRATVSVLFAVAAAGAALLAASTGLAAAIAAQILIGIGCAPVFMGTLVILTRFLPPKRFAAMSSLMLALGSTGTLLGATPLALLAASLGWRGAMLAVGGIVLALAAATALLVRDHPNGAGAERPVETLAQAFGGLGEVLRIHELWPILPIAFTAYGVLITVRGIWAGPFLDSAFGLGPVERGNVLLAMSVAMIGGTLAYAALEQRTGRRRELVLVGGSVSVTLLALLSVFGAASLVATTALLAGLGITGMTYAMIMAQGRRFMPPERIGRGLTMLNCAAFTGAAVLQSASGFVVAWSDSWVGTPSSHRVLFAALAAALAMALLAHRRSVDRPD